VSIAMDVSELRKQILRALDEARQDASARRTRIDEARAAYERFLGDVAVPLMRQSAMVLTATAQPFQVHTPAASARLAHDQQPLTFLELELDVAGDRPQVIGRVSVSRGRSGTVVTERPIAPGKTVAELTEADVSTFLVAEIPRLVLRA
jgi:hypothetical protein